MCEFSLRRLDIVELENALEFIRIMGIQIGPICRSPVILILELKLCRGDAMGLNVAIHQKIVTHRLAQIRWPGDAGEAIGEISILHGDDFSRLHRPYQTRFFKLRIVGRSLLELQ